MAIKFKIFKNGGYFNKNALKDLKSVEIQISTLNMRIILISN